VTSIGRHHADPGAELDERLQTVTAFASMSRMALPAIPRHKPVPPAAADLADQVQDHVLGRGRRRALAVEVTRMRLGLAGPATASPARGSPRSRRRRRRWRLRRHACRCGCRRTQQVPGRLTPCSGPMTWTDALARLARSNSFMPSAWPRRACDKAVAHRASACRACGRLGRDDVVEGGEGEVGLRTR